MVLFVEEDVIYKSSMCAAECKRVEKKPREEVDVMKKETV